MVLLGAVSALLIVALVIAVRNLWRAVRVRRRPRRVPWPGPGGDAALRRHPAGRGRHTALVSGDQAGARSAQWPPPTGPDDDPEFINALERLIRGDGDGGYPLS